MTSARPGSKTMFLIYRLTDPESLFSGFTGVDGSAYVVGGVGLTFLTDGKIVDGADPVRPRPAHRRQHRLCPLHAAPTWNPF